MDILDRKFKGNTGSRKIRIFKRLRYMSTFMQQNKEGKETFETE